MSTAIKINDDQLISNARVHAEAQNRSINKQIQHWCLIGQIAEENPELSYNMIQKLLVSEAEVSAGQVTTYSFS